MALLSVADALARILDGVTPLPAIAVPVADADGRVLAADLVSLRTQPPADLSAMDGYAVRAANVASTPATLRLIGEVAAGHPFDGTVGPGEAARIFTGGVVPPGADTIVIQENTSRDGNQIAVTAPAAAGRHIRRVGLDFAAGDTPLRAGRLLTPRDIMLAAAMNHPAVPVHRPPRVAILATGDELVRPGQEPGPGEIVYSNGFAIQAIARRQGAEAFELGIAPDRVDETVAAIRQARAREADILVTTGGASVGDYDLVQQALAAEGLNLSFWKVALRPGKPLMHGRLGAMHVIGLPGNPVSAVVCSILFLAPLIRRLCGHERADPTIETARIGRDLPANDERADYMRATLRETDDGPVATPLPTQDSSMIAALARADCLVVREPHNPPLRTGDLCRILRLTGVF